MLNCKEFKERLLHLNSSSSLHHWCDSVNEIIGFYDLDDKVIYQTIMETIPQQLISSEAVKNFQADSYIELLQALQDYEFSKNCGKLFMELSNNKKMESQKFEEIFGKLQAEYRSADDLKPFLAAMALENDQTKRNDIFEYLSTHPGARYEDAVKNVISKT